MLKAFIDIFRHWKDNQRAIYPEPPAHRDIYGKDFYHALHTPKEKVDYLLNLCPIPYGAMILDIGCGRGELIFKALEQGCKMAVGIDYSEDALVAAARLAANSSHKNFQFKAMDATQLDFADNFFDAIFMADIVEHLTDEQLTKALQEVRRVLKPGGWFILHTEPTVLYKKFAQYFVRDYFMNRNIPWMDITIREEAKLGHINIQSHQSLNNYLQRAFPHEKSKVFYAPIHQKGRIKSVIRFLNLWPFFSPHLWAKVQKNTVCP